MLEKKQEEKAENKTPCELWQWSENAEENNKELKLFTKHCKTEGSYTFGAIDLNQLDFHFERSLITICASVKDEKTHSAPDVFVPGRL